jgi:hypothetical protein
MIQGYQIRRVIIVLIAVVLLVLLVAGIANLIRGDNGGAEATPEPEDIVLTNYDTDDSRLRLIYDGKVIANETRRSLRITISSDERLFELLEGYDGVAIKRKTYPNTSSAYENLVRAADFEGFILAQDNNLGDDERGVCPEGQRTVTELINDGDVISRLWAASCNRKLGTLAGDSKALLRLFQNQIPDYKELTQGVKF